MIIFNFNKSKYLKNKNNLKIFFFLNVIICKLLITCILTKKNQNIYTIQNNLKSTDFSY